MLRELITAQESDYSHSPRQPCYNCYIVPHPIGGLDSVSPWHRALSKLVPCAFWQQGNGILVAAVSLSWFLYIDHVTWRFGLLEGSTNIGMVTSTSLHWRCHRFSSHSCHYSIILILCWRALRSEINIILNLLLTRSRKQNKTNTTSQTATSQWTKHHTLMLNYHLLLLLNSKLAHGKWNLADQAKPMHY